MPYLTTIIPSVSAADKDSFLAAWPTIASTLKAQSTVLGVSGGPIVAEDGAPVTEFKFLQTIAFATLEDQKAFEESDVAKEGKKKYDEKATGPPQHATFEVPDFPKDHKPAAYTQISRMTITDESKGPEIKKAWEELTTILGKPTWGGKAVGAPVGIALVSWDSLEEAGAAYKGPAKAAWDHYHTFGETKDMIVKLEVA
ncbi:hypothetical protein PZA11_006792 [Diplocarpon coronariae]|uniref:ABM domain-containing protein n=1 Tax=Diplocarpon coronariae TaxID=2795749 RepID=A0A218YU56_9HELO|nr:hypothetical protein B2J93_6089 [Marssonina coronariae]